jgi:UV DNA damage endonuclease
MNVGYACINLTLGKKITTNRTMRKATFEQKGIAYASELALKNCQDLLKILEWNEEHGIKLFRVSSEIFPWASEYDLKDLPDFEEICEVLTKAGNFAKAHNHRLTSHPGPFNKLCSPKENVIKNTIRDLEIHGELFDLMGLGRTPYNSFCLHVGAAYNDKEATLKRFCENFELLPESVKTRLAVENDDKSSLYSTKELYEGVHKVIGVPVIHDFYHHTFNTGSLSQEEALSLAASTWGDITPVTHHSESRAVEQNDPKIKATAHSDYITYLPETYGIDVDIVVESKKKDLAILPFI